MKFKFKYRNITCQHIITPRRKAQIINILFDNGNGHIERSQNCETSTGETGHMISRLTNANYRLFGKPTSFFEASIVKAANDKSIHLLIGFYKRKQTRSG